MVKLHTVHSNFGLACYISVTKNVIKCLQTLSRVVRRITLEISSKLTVKFQNSGGKKELVKNLKLILKRKNRGSTYYSQ